MNHIQLQKDIEVFQYFPFKEESFEIINNSLVQILKKSNVKEFKWEKLRNAKYFFCAKHILDFILLNLFEYQIRLDILTWDITDSRHKVKGRDDSANFGRMFFRVLKHSLSCRNISCKWKIYPDEKVDMDWKTLNDCLVSVGNWERVFEFPLFNGSKIGSNYTITDFEQKSSKEFPCIQVTDLFAGL